MENSTAKSIQFIRFSFLKHFYEVLGKTMIKDLVGFTLWLVKWTAIWVVIIGILFTFLAGAANVACPYNSPQTEKIRSASLSDQTEGTFSLFGGSIDEGNYYFYYAQNGRGLELRKTPADTTIIIETDNRKPEIKRIHCRHNKLYVPENTVIKKFEVRQPGLE